MAWRWGAKGASGGRVVWVNPFHEYGVKSNAQCRAVCRRSKLVDMGTRRHRPGSPLYTRWALQEIEVGVSEQEEASKRSPIVVRWALTTCDASGRRGNTVQPLYGWE